MSLAATEYQLATLISQALGIPARHPRSDENPACITVWSVRELDDIFARIGGAVTARPVTRGLSDGSTFDVIELVLVADLADLGTAAVTTDWDPADEAHGFALPVVIALSAATV